jgi:large subunit ribosomal protein L10
MARPEKVAVVDEIAEKIERTQSLFLTDFSGLDVETISELRRLLRESAVEFKVVKNTLARLAAVKAGREDLKPYLTGPTAMAFGYEDPILPARLLSSFAQKTGKPSVKAVLFEGQLLGQGAMDRLKTLAPREEILARMVTGLKAPLFQTVMVLSGLLRSCVIVLDAIARKRGEEEGKGPSQGEKTVEETATGVKAETEAGEKAGEEIEAAVEEKSSQAKGEEQKPAAQMSSPPEEEKTSEGKPGEQEEQAADSQDSQKKQHSKGKSESEEKEKN